MESIVNFERKEKTFPRLMIFKSGDCEMIALFSNDRCATIVNVNEGSSHKVGDFSSDWTIGLWFDFEGDVVLKN